MFVCITRCVSRSQRHTSWMCCVYLITHHKKIVRIFYDKKLHWNSHAQSNCKGTHKTNSLYAYLEPYFDLLVLSSDGRGLKIKETSQYYAGTKPIQSTILFLYAAQNFLGIKIRKGSFSRHWYVNCSVAITTTGGANFRKFPRNSLGRNEERVWVCHGSPLPRPSEFCKFGQVSVRPCTLPAFDFFLNLNDPNSANFTSQVL